MTREEKEVKLRMILQDYHRRNDYGLQQAVNDILALDALPPAEGAEDLKQYMTNLLYYVADPANVPADQLDHWIEEMVNGIDEYFKSEQPTAEGAEEILVDVYGCKDIEELKRYFIGEISLTMILDAMNKFATLHAQRIADKMVEEKLKKEYERGIEDGKIIGKHGSVSYIE